MNPETSRRPSASDEWLRAAAFFGVRMQSGELPGRPEGVLRNVLMMARCQYAAELSMQRLSDAHARRKTHVQQSSDFAGMGKVLATYLEAHAFLVSADLFWKSLAALHERVRVPGARGWKRMRAIAGELSAHSRTIDRTHACRQRIEHVDKRVKLRRSDRQGASSRMTAAPIHGALGVFDGRCLSFGRERFDLVQMHEAVRATGYKLAPMLVQSFEPPRPARKRRARKRKA